MLVSGRENFAWRNGRMGDLITLIGDGLLTTDGDYHDTSRAIMMPAFHRERVAAAAEVMGEEAEPRLDDAAGAADAPTSTRWTRDLAMRIAMRRPVRLRPRLGPRHRDRRPISRAASASTAASSRCSCCSAPARRWRSCSATAPRSSDSSARRSAGGAARGEDGDDILGSLLAATDEEGDSLSDGQVLDHVLTLLFAGHDTTTSTVSFLDLRARPQPRVGRSARRRAAATSAATREPTAEQLFGELPLLTRAIDETLRLYPPAWIGPRRVGPRLRVQRRPGAGRAAVHLQLLGQPSPARRLRGPGRFDPDRFEPERRAKLAARRLRPVRDGPARLHRQALRLHRGARDRRGAAAPLPLRAARRARARRSSRRRRSRRRAACRCGCCRAEPIDYGCQGAAGRSSATEERGDERASTRSSERQRATCGRSATTRQIAERIGAGGDGCSSRGSGSAPASACSTSPAGPGTRRSSPPSAGAVVTGLDLTPKLLEIAGERAAAAGARDRLRRGRRREAPLRGRLLRRASSRSSG